MLGKWWSTLRSWLGRSPRPLTPPVIRAVRLSEAFICAHCRWVCEGLKKQSCRLCGSTEVVSISRQLAILEERLGWYRKIYRTLRAQQASALRRRRAVELQLCQHPRPARAGPQAPDAATQTETES